MPWYCILLVLNIAGLSLPQSVSASEALQARQPSLCGVNERNMQAACIRPNPRRLAKEDSPRPHPTPSGISAPSSPRVHSVHFTIGCLMLHLKRLLLSQPYAAGLTRVAAVPAVAPECRFGP